MFNLWKCLFIEFRDIKVQQASIEPCLTTWMCAGWPDSILIAKGQITYSFSLQFQRGSIKAYMPYILFFPGPSQIRICIDFGKCPGHKKKCPGNEKVKEK